MLIQKLIYLLLPLIKIVQNIYHVYLSRVKLEDPIDEFDINTIKPYKITWLMSTRLSDIINEITLVDEMTKYQKYKELLKILFGKDPNKKINSDEVVIIDKTIQAGVLQRDIKICYY